MNYYNDSKLLYEKGYNIIINNGGKPVEESIFYYFDYDQREFKVNMDFPHLHIFYELMILLSPKAKHYIAGVPYDIRAGDVVLLSPSVLHQSEYCEGEPSDRIIIDFMYPKAYLEKDPAYTYLLSVFRMPIPILRLNPLEQEILFGPLNELTRLAEQATPPSIKSLLVHSRFQEFLYQLWSLQGHNTYLAQNSLDSIKERIYAVTNYIHLHYSEELTLSRLGAEFFMSVYYLSHKFKEITGFTVNNYIQRTRIQNAQYMLQNSKDSISDIAHKAGFNSFSQFNRVFRKYCDMAPSDYQKHAQNRSFLPCQEQEQNVRPGSIHMVNCGCPVTYGVHN